jgi:hypothetical protein
MVKSMMGPEEIYLAMDPAALNKKSESTWKTLGDYLGEKQIRAVTANNARLDWRNLLKTLIHRGKLKICSNCVNLIRTMPMMIHAKVNVEDMDSSWEDHAVDALRYWVMEIIWQKGVANPQEILKNTSKDEDDFSFSQKR